MSHSQISIFKLELAKEAQITRKMLERIPADKLSWQPHPKSMTVGALAAHIAELPEWIKFAVTTDGLDFAATPYEAKVFTDPREIIESFEESLETGLDALEVADEDQLDKAWTLRAGEQVLDQNTKAGVIRMTLSQGVHHRAQLGVFLRLLDVPIPGSYGPSADEH